MPKKKKAKYKWAIGEPLPELDEHSQAKHRIISDYIQRYVEVYMSNTAIERLSLSIVDGFAGGGKYRDVLTNDIADGSPFVILNAIHEVEQRINLNRIKPRSIDAHYYFIDCIKQHTDFLRNEIQQSQYRALIDDSIFIQTDEFARAAPAVIDAIHRRNRTHRSLFILDQYAYKDVPFNTVNYILNKLIGSEVILTFNVNAILNYISDNEANKTALANIHLENHIDWQRLTLLKEAGQWKQAVQEQLANAIYKASGARHITLFFITPKAGLTYWLVHLSKVYRARDVMMSLHWKHSNSSFSHHLSEGLFSLGYSAIETPGQMGFDLVTEFDFGEEAEQRCVQRLSDDIPRLIYAKNEPLTFANLVDSIGSHTPAAENQIRQALTRGLKSGELLIKMPNGKYRRSASQAKDEDLVSYCQRPLIFL